MYTQLVRIPRKKVTHRVQGPRVYLYSNNKDKKILIFFRQTLAIRKTEPKMCLATS
jgi:hypothetical protein